MADHDGIAEIEHAALSEIAVAPLVDKAALLRTVPVRTAVRRAII